MEILQFTNEQLDKAIEKARLGAEVTAEMRPLPHLNKGLQEELYCGLNERPRYHPAMRTRAERLSGANLGYFY